MKVVTFDDLDAELLKRMRRYKRAPSKRQICSRFSAIAPEDAIESSLLRLLNGGKIAVTDKRFWARKAADS